METVHTVTQAYTPSEATSLRHIATVKKFAQHAKAYLATRYGKPCLRSANDNLLKPFMTVLYRRSLAMRDTTKWFEFFVVICVCVAYYLASN